MIARPQSCRASIWCHQPTSDRKPNRDQVVREHLSHGFTLVEVMIGMTLALIVMAAMMNTFLYLGRNLNRLANQHLLETTSRLTLSQFGRDARQAEAASNTADLDSAGPTTAPTDSAVKFWNIPTSNGGVTNVTYDFNSITQTLTRSDSASGTSRVILRYIQYFDLNYFNTWGLPQTSATSPYNQSSIPNVISIKCVELRVTMRMGDKTNNTTGFMTPEYSAVSPRLALRNRNLLE